MPLQLSLTNIKDYTILSKIGEGTFAYIYRAENTLLQIDDPLRCIAIKRFKHEFTEIGKQEAEIMELVTGRNVRLDGCIEFYGSFELDGSFVIALELLDWTRKLSLVNQNPRRIHNDFEMYKNLAKLGVQLLTTLVDINDAGYVHCDIKPDNILYTEGQGHTKVKLIDFGNSTLKADLSEYTDDFKIQTAGYRAPEVLIGDPTFNKKIDVWSVGVVLLELTINQLYKAFRNEWKLIIDGNLGPSVRCISKVIESFDAYKDRNTRFWKDQYASASLRPENVSVMIRTLAGVMFQNEVSKLALDFLLCLLRVDHYKRWSASEALRHPFLIYTLQGTWGKVLFTGKQHQDQLVYGDSQLRDLGLLG